jgi:hypothetical protein
VSPVARVSETPPTLTVVVAWIVVVPVVGELITTVHEPGATPFVVQLLGPTNVADAPPAFDSENVITVPAGAFTYPAPSPALTFTCPVSVWVVPIGLVAVGGLIWMFASTNVFTASTEFPFVPSVATVTWTPPANVNVAVACPVTFPAVGEVKVIVHWPFASVFAPAFVHVPVGVECAAPFESVSVTATCSPAAGTNVPVPVSFSNVTVNVCDTPISFVALGAIAICARTLFQIFVASGLSPAFVSPVDRVSGTPATVTFVVAWIVVVPIVGELITTVHDPVPPDVVQLDGPTNVADAPPAFDSVKLIVVPSGAFTNPVPGLTFTCPVRVCSVETGLVAVCGVIWMFASTTCSGSHGPTPATYVPSPP